jgi:hypothetical protein
VLLLIVEVSIGELPINSQLNMALIDEVTGTPVAPLDGSTILIVLGILSIVQDHVAISVLPTVSKGCTLKSILEEEEGKLLYVFGDVHHGSLAM